MWRQAQGVGCSLENSSLVSMSFTICDTAWGWYRRYTLCKTESHGCWMQAVLAQPQGASRSPQLPNPTPSSAVVMGGQDE